MDLLKTMKTERRRTKSAQLTVRLDEALKHQAEINLEKLGLTATDAVTRLYRFIAEHGRMPVEERIVTYEPERGQGGHEADLPRRFLSFLADQGIHCNEPARFIALNAGCAHDQDSLWHITLAMQQARRHALEFIATRPTLDGLPGLLVSEFGFSTAQGVAIQQQIQPARPGQD
ncbi:type II toxin-antitoxin system RelB/DinJ family antitoxin [Klebsiella pneumoniae]|uniref:type II toxin-antitoxin system RelB/DinJ family antitoxin n=1 Tax=Klebsiella pneumoniae TaxID=573 RepID=UPI001D0E029A|nr:type II toxin-antitoxin system RelB/DinJ family antitoxin [Klebsiella pneumoniae]